ncbi:hypodermin-B-like [Pararge aegeria]|uniref:hypodermin-B-like n=1 Tax=Pararge aegeria TaxID=116150 RepID=UPI0019D1D2B4|nr:hypodermin-B-like [Pararge aegeria]
MEARVVNGILTNIQIHPHSVFLFMRELDDGHVCGGSIVNQRVILSAAHCFEGITKLGVITANVGSSHSYKGLKFLVKSVRVHQKYDTIKIINDIALAGLENSIVFGLNTKRIVIAKQKSNEGMAKLAGWGVVQEYPRYEYSNYLHEVLVPFMSREKCKILYERIDKGTFCGGRINAVSHPSVGDSGSPLVFKNYTQIGLVSYKNNQISKSMIIYTDVPYYYNWIVENARSVFCKDELHVPDFNYSHIDSEEGLILFRNGR